MTIVLTDDGKRIKLVREPVWSEHWQNWSVPGHRWIKTKQHWSANALCFTCKSFTKEQSDAEA